MIPYNEDSVSMDRNETRRKGEEGKEKERKKVQGKDSVLTGERR